MIRDQGGKSVLERAHRILTALRADGAPTTLTELARASAIPLSTTHRITAELVRLGQLEKGVDGHYTAGISLWELGERASIARRLREAATPELTDLYDRTGENAHLGVLVGREVLYVAKSSGARAIPTISRVGLRHPLHATGVGRALLADFDTDALDDYLQTPLAQITSFTITDPGRLRAELAATRERGYAVTRQEMTLGNASIAIAVRSRADLPPSSIGLVTHLATADAQRLVPLIKRAVQSVQIRLDALR